ncbi:alpha-galactosidase [Marchantia polymorpha subsp. ruderalis]|uniref:Alpha-galactosidase n=2 Tax=Marchantia polymorpha TaxID=3197 RepID=A0AAF6AQF7_MARPO|nr:hypothetical protein MARPO_0033s0125 [Marchantia polymorpha]BBM98677.1 hypothetical protein Mp_1g15360 [Marchantia polymorpha subsp. ruderalis]|eukprot:PTQ41731.1 hypothetical protein MARPO_0033s0125 [Marchantia polymorpha]
MKILSCYLLLAVLLVSVVPWLSAGKADSSGHDKVVRLAETPPRGWNSYDSFSWIVTEEEFLQNAEYVAANLSKHGYEYVVVDFLWYRRFEQGASVWSGGHEVIDEYGRLMPDPGRWPSTVDGKGFKPIAEKVHAMGLKFGIHVMRGISTEAVQTDTKICNAMGSPDGAEGCYWTAKDVALAGTECSWMKACFMSVNTTSEGGLAFINSLYQQYADWGIDFIKHDCVFGVDDLSVDEITAVSKAISRTGRPMVYSLSPGVRATPKMAKEVASLTHMYRVTSDDWDLWWEVLLHFPVARDFAAAGLIGAPGLQGGLSWPDLDMLPLGWLTDPGVNYGPYRSCSLTRAEQRTQVTLWSIAKSPLIFGGDLRNLDQWTFDLITNPTVLEMNAHSTRNQEFRSSPAGFLPVVTLEDCVSAASTQWKLQRGKDDLMEVCWSRSSRLRYSRGRQQPVLTGCLNWTKTPWMHKETSVKSERGLLWREAGLRRICLDADKSLTDAMEGSAGFRLCNNSASQVWHLTPEGRLVSEEAGLCAAVVQPEQGWRIWVARGTSGQGYVAFFNLGENRQNLSVPLEDVLRKLDLSTSGGSVLHQAIDLWLRKIWKQLFRTFDYLGSKVYPQQNIGSPVTLRRSEWTCICIDVWEGKPQPRGIITSSVTASVEGHGTTLIELTCVRSPRHSQATIAMLSVLFLPFIMTVVAYLVPRNFWNKLMSGRVGVSPIEKALIGG